MIREFQNFFATPIPEGNLVEEPFSGCEEPLNYNLWAQSRYSNSAVTLLECTATFKAIY